MQRFKKHIAPRANINPRTAQPATFGARYGWALGHQYASQWTGKFNYDELSNTRENYRVSLLLTQEMRRSDVVGWLSDDGVLIRCTVSQCEISSSFCRLYAGMAASRL